MVHIGNQTSCWAASPTEPFDYALTQAFDAFEWFPDKKPGTGWNEEDLTIPAREAIAETARSRGVRFSVHARWQANLLSPEGVALFWNDLDLARHLGAALINIHLDHEQGMGAFIDALVPLVRRTAEIGLQLSIENTPLHTPEQFNDLFARLHKLDSLQTSHVGMCFDLGHANLCATTRNDFLQFYDRLDPNLPINHLHLHENWGDTDSHLPLFTGPSARDDSGIRGLVARLNKRHYSGSIILEQWPHPPSLLNAARDRLLKLWLPEPKSADPSSKREISTARHSISKDPTELDLVTELTEADRTRRSWREKLDFVRDLLASDRPAVTSDQLVDIAIYLRFLGTGEIACSEDGRHFRPAQHARLASQIQDRLAKLATPENQFIVRKIYPWLPSSAPTFQRPEPLTRIRDIAHRNDIPQDLKREIKTTLQNKLHRCAGPEDLATSTALLERITRPGTNYSPGFIDQFKVFHEELKEFFNAQSLEQRLTGIAPVLGARGADLIRQFLKQKRQPSTVAAGVPPAVEPGVPPGGSLGVPPGGSLGVPPGGSLGPGGAASQKSYPGGETPSSTSGGTPDATGLLATFRTLTDLRRACLERVAQKPGAETEALLHADIALEDFAFVLLSEMINAWGTLGTSSAAAYQTEALIIALQNLVYSGIDPIESAAAQNELKSWGTVLHSADRNQLLRQKATLLRCRRLAEDFGARVIALFSARAEKLGRALAVAEHAIRVFSEADIRSHIVFQISKLATHRLRQIRQQLKLPPWDVLVPGEVSGRVATLDTLEGSTAEGREPVIALLRNAVGDEEIPKHITGMLLAHELPHLSHLAVRARQARVVFVACEEFSEFDRLQTLQNERIVLNATPDKVEWKKVERVALPKRHAPSNGATAPPTELTQQCRCIPLEQATADTCGGKAAGARLLTALSHQANVGFATPSALAIPFGVMEEALRASPAVEAEYWQAVQQLGSLPAAQIRSAADRLRALVQQLPIPNEIIAEVRRKFASPLIVRSSANCEDTEAFAGAGLYESVPNVAPAEVASAIRQVWASLWTSRATLSRREAGIAHEQAHMAVLIQELLSSDFAFVLHTINPVSGDPQALYGEIVVGLGETLVSAAAGGDPYRFICNKRSGTVEILAFANFSKAARPGFMRGFAQSPSGPTSRQSGEATEPSPSPRVEERAGKKRPGTPHETAKAFGSSLAAVNSPSSLLRGKEGGEGLYSETIDYSTINLSRDPSSLESLARRLCKIGVLVEQAIGKPQDIEGAVIQDKIYLVQTRPQQGL